MAELDSSPSSLVDGLAKNDTVLDIKEDVVENNPVSIETLNVDQAESAFQNIEISSPNEGSCENEMDSIKQVEIDYSVGIEAMNVDQTKSAFQNIEIASSNGDKCEKEMDCIKQVEVGNEALNVDHTENVFQNIEIANPNGDSCENEMDCTKQVEAEQFSVHYEFENYTAIGKFDEPHMKHFVGCKWSPDGTCLLTTCADYTLRIFDLPQSFHSKSNWNSSESMSKLQPSLMMKEGGTIYDFAWYPLMSSWEPLTCCFISSSAGSPVHLWDAYTGKIRASYRAYDYADEVHSALSLGFSNDGINIYCGFRHLVKVFDISVPGRDCNTINLKVVSGQKGIVSCISVNPLMPELFAVGTYSKTIGLYTNSDEFICMLTGQQSGLTHLKFSSDGLRLYSGGRMDNEIICWDIRNPGTVLSTYERVVTTNQRIYFDLSMDDKYLISGGTDGVCRVWNLHEETNLNSEGKLKQCFKFKVHDDCVNSVSLHKSYPVLATASGQYHYPQLTEDDDDEEIFSAKRMNGVENTVKLWWIGPINSHNENMCVDS